jgi:hypothetical protein
MLGSPQAMSAENEAQIGVELTGRDIGEPRQAGSTARVTGGYDLLAGGADIWQASDQFHFAYAKVKGDFDMWARLDYFSVADEYSKAGIMARESLDAGGRHAFFVAFPDNRPRNRNNGGFEFQYRLNPYSASAAIYPSDSIAEPPQFPIAIPASWLRLRRIGARFDSLCRVMNGEWKLYSSFSLPMSAEAYLGFALTSHNAERLVAARFRNVAVLRS